MKLLTNIETFGAVDADSDDYLLDCFEDHNAYKHVLERKRYLVVGRKGAGKTAIFKKLITTKEPSVFSFGHTFMDYPWHYHDRQARIGIPDRDKYTHSWQYLILLTLSKIILNKDNSLPYNDSSMEKMVKIEKFVVDSYGTKDPDVTQVFSPGKMLRLRPNIEFNIAEIVKMGIAPEQVPIEYLPVIVQEVNTNLLGYILEVLNPENSYFVCFDQLDLGFEPGNPDYTSRLIGLILAARYINQKAKEAGKKLFITVFLRDDIYNDLRFEDKNKITENNVSVIEWDTSRTEYTLKRLMEKRFKATIGENIADVNWEQVFDEKNQMPSRQSKYQHIINRTFLRPRDIIRFCNAILGTAKKRIAAGPNTEELFLNEDIHKSRESYSSYFVKEIDDEIHKHIPNYRNYFEIFKSIGVYRFSLEQFLSEYEKRKSSCPEIKDPIEILKKLYEFSVVAYYKAGGRGFGGSGYVSKYENPDDDFDNTAKMFQVHPGLIETLGLKIYEK